MHTAWVITQKETSGFGFGTERDKHLNDDTMITRCTLMDMAIRLLQ
jgi:hypothetical protein